MTEPIAPEEETPEEPDEAESGTPEAPESPEEDDEPEAPVEVPPDAEPQGLTPEGWEKRARSAEQRFTRYASGITDLYEEDATRLLLCPLCPDWHKGFVNLDDAGHIPDEIAHAVKMYLGIAREQDYAPDPGTNACPTCQGKGKTKTGSTVPGQEVHTCPNCKGYGYVPPPAATQKLNGAPLPAVDMPALEEALHQSDDVDNWNEPRILPDGRENPNFGKMPDHKIRVEPYGITAGLNAMDVPA